MKNEESVNPTSDAEIILDYKGQITDVWISQKSRWIQDLTKNNRKLSRKVFYIFIELSQNIQFYSAQKTKLEEKEESIGKVLILKYPQHYKMIFTNAIRKDQHNKLEQDCEFINTLSREKLREHKKNILDSPPPSTSKGAGIGLVQVCLVSGNSLGYQFQDINGELSVFSITIQVEY